MKPCIPFFVFLFLTGMAGSGQALTIDESRWNNVWELWTFIFVILTWGALMYWAEKE